MILLIKIIKLAIFINLDQLFIYLLYKELESIIICSK